MANDEQTTGEIDATARRVATLIQRHEHFILSTHRDPDGDGLGAEAALRDALLQLGKQVHVINTDPVPVHYRFLEGDEPFEVFDPSVHHDLIAGADVVILLDASTAERTGRPADAMRTCRGLSVAIDHHPGGGWASLEWIDESAGATTALVFGLLQQLPVRLTPAMAGALYCGLATDTLGFRAAQTTAESHRLAAVLIDAGAPVGRVHDALFGSWTPGRLQMLGEFLTTLRAESSGRIVWGVVTRDMLARWQQTTDSIEGFVEEILRLAGVELAVLFLEEPRTVRVSLRSRGALRVDDLARRLGGGGHAHSAGTRLPGTLDEIIRHCLQEVAVAFVDAW